MTVQIPQKDIFDKILATLGKKRAVHIPKEGLTEKYGVYKCRKESLMRALLRPKDAKPPEGWEYWDNK